MHLAWCIYREIILNNTFREISIWPFNRWRNSFRKIKCVPQGQDLNPCLQSLYLGYHQYHHYLRKRDPRPGEQAWNLQRYSSQQRNKGTLDVFMLSLPQSQAFWTLLCGTIHTNYSKRSAFQHLALQLQVFCSFTIFRNSACFQEGSQSLDMPSLRRCPLPFFLGELLIESNNGQNVWLQKLDHKRHVPCVLLSDKLSCHVRSPMTVKWLHWRGHMEVS